ncbi:glutamate-rich protein 2 isoform X2 [Esox lucius]|uniref:glutamate-rich protein 2 isoform X2 n=1 Tax=Esox lucius TaxID=8010 RepID=UPI001477016C|nr:glutamate-rich protein 2 isoform X2 [Esox lucius]
MSGLECYGKSSKVPQKRVVPKLFETSTHNEAVVSNPTTATPRSLPTQAVKHPVKDSPTVRLEVFSAVGEKNISVGLAGSPVILSHDRKMKYTRKPQQSASGGTEGRVDVHPLDRTPLDTTCDPPLAEPLLPREAEREEELTKNNGDDAHDDEGQCRAPLELMAEFLKSVMEKDFVLAKKLCQMILIYEPENPEARQFIVLIQEKLQREQDKKSSKHEDEDSGDSDDNGSNSSDEDGLEDSGSDEDSAQSSESTSSTSSTSSNEEEENKLTP